MYLKLLTDSFCTETSEPDTEDEWDRASTSTEWSVKGVRLVLSDEYGVMRVCFPVEAGERVFALYAIYSDGDSFGRDEGRGLEVIDFFKDESKAQTAAAALSGADSEWKREDGSIAKMGWKPWDGYFESLDSMNVVGFEVQP